MPSLGRLPLVLGERIDGPSSILQSRPAYALCRQVIGLRGGRTPGERALGLGL